VAEIIEEGERLPWLIRLGVVTEKIVIKTLENV
jgi:hypothetical protein